MKPWYLRLFCRHKRQEFVRRIYGDEINWVGCRELWVCVDCGRTIRKVFV